MGIQEMVGVQKPTAKEIFQREENDQQPDAAVRKREMKTNRVSDQRIYNNTPYRETLPCIYSQYTFQQFKHIDNYFVLSEDRIAPLSLPKC